MSEMIAFCGLNCTKCPSFIALRNDDDRLRKKTAALYIEKFGFDLKPDDINCDGCKSSSGVRIAYCKTCEIRQCCRKKGLDNCASCNELPCEKLVRFHEFSPDAKASFEKAFGGIN